MIAVRRENVGQTDHCFHQRADVGAAAGRARLRGTLYRASSLSIALRAPRLVDRQQTDRSVFRRLPRKYRRDRPSERDPYSRIRCARRSVLPKLPCTGIFLNKQMAASAQCFSQQLLAFGLDFFRAL